MLDKILLIIVPFLAVLVAIAATLNSFRKKQFNFSSLSADYNASKEFYNSAFPWFLGALLLALGHLFSVLFPGCVLAFNESAPRLYVHEGIGLIVRVLVLLGLFQVFKKLLAKKGPGFWSNCNTIGLLLVTIHVLIGIVIVLNYRWQTSWFAGLVAPYLHSLIKFKPDLSLLSSMPLLVKIQLANTFLMLALIPLVPFLRVVLLVLVYPRRALEHISGCRCDVEALKEFTVQNKTELKKAGIAFGLLFGLVVFGLLVFGARSIGFTEGYAPEQPIKFSHKTHAGDNKIQCVYCHFAAQSGRHAGVPPTELCMNCHTSVKKDSPEIKKIVEALEAGKSIQWNKVNHFPDFAYFNHSQHVMIGKVACQQCHGEVQTFVVMKQQKNLSMGWCINCHREKEIAAPKNHKSSSGADCAKCHY